MIYVYLIEMKHNWKYSRMLFISKAIVPYNKGTELPPAYPYPLIVFRRCFVNKYGSVTRRSTYELSTFE